jgi:hypothetical protein
MRTLDDRISLAADCIAFCQTLRNAAPALSEAGS